MTSSTARASRHVPVQGAAALANIRATAPVDTGAYRDGFRIEVHKSAHRNSYRVVGHDWKTILLESKGGYLARALKAVK